MCRRGDRLVVQPEEVGLAFVRVRVRVWVRVRVRVRVRARVRVRVRVRVSERVVAAMMQPMAQLGR